MYFQIFLIQVAALFIASGILAFVFWLFVKPNLLKYFNSPDSGNTGNSASLLPLRIQAHERLVVFIDRLNPVNMLLRFPVQGISVQELQGLILNDIRQEYQHNITQQLYVSHAVWTTVSKLKEDTAAMIRSAAQNLPAEAGGAEVSKRILQHMASVEQNPYNLAMDLIKADIHKLF